MKNDEKISGFFFSLPFSLSFFYNEKVLYLYLFNPRPRKTSSSRRLARSLSPLKMGKNAHRACSAEQSACERVRASLSLSRHCIVFFFSLSPSRGGYNYHRRRLSVAVFGRAFGRERSKVSSLASLSLSLFLSLFFSILSAAGTSSSPQRGSIKRPRRSRRRPLP